MSLSTLDQTRWFFNDPTNYTSSDESTGYDGEDTIPISIKVYKGDTLLKNYVVDSSSYETETIWFAKDFSESGEYVSPYITLDDTGSTYEEIYGYGSAEVTYLINQGVLPSGSTKGIYLVTTSNARVTYSKLGGFNEISFEFLRTNATYQSEDLDDYGTDNASVISWVENHLTEFPWVTPIYDRTKADITERNSKAYINYTDMNRIEKDIHYLCQLSGITHTLKTWAMGDHLLYSDFSAIITTLDSLKATLPSSATPPSYPSTPGTKYTFFNKIERFIQWMYDYLL